MGRNSQDCLQFLSPQEILSIFGCFGIMGRGCPFNYLSSLPFAHAGRDGGVNLSVRERQPKEIPGWACSRSSTTHWSVRRPSGPDQEVRGCSLWTLDSNKKMEDGFFETASKLLHRIVARWFTCVFLSKATSSKCCGSKENASPWWIFVITDRWQVNKFDIWSVSQLMLLLYILYSCIFPSFELTWAFRDRLCIGILVWWD